MILDAYYPDRMSGRPKAVVPVVAGKMAVPRESEQGLFARLAPDPKQTLMGDLLLDQIGSLNRLARSLKARSPPSRMSHTYYRICGFSRLPLSYVISGNCPGL